MTDDDAPLTVPDPAPPRSAKTAKKADKTAKKMGRRPASCAVEVPEDHVWVGSAGVWVPQAWPAMHPLVGQLVSEDVSWRLGVLHWRATRPRPLRWRARAQWRADGAVLAAKRQRLCAAAAELGFRPTS